MLTRNTFSWMYFAQLAGQYHSINRETGFMFSKRIFELSFNAETVAEIVAYGFFRISTKSGVIVCLSGPSFLR